MAAGKEDEETTAAKRRRRENEDEEESKRTEIKRAEKGARLGTPSFAPVAGATSEELTRRAAPLIDQVNALYNQYRQGLERFPPNILRKQLEALVDQLQKIPNTSAAEQFRVNGLKASFSTYRDKWDRLIKDIESGKVRIPIVKK